MPTLENLTFDELSDGDSATFSKTLTERELLLFAAASGDVNPIHINPDYAETTSFKKQIAHGMWSGSLISATLATVMPGPGTIYLSQNLKFKRPTHIGDTLTVTVTVEEKKTKRNIVVFNCEVVNQDNKLVTSGTAEVIAPAEKIQVEEPKLPDINIQ